MTYNRDDDLGFWGVDKATVAVDFDGVIHSYVTPWEGTDIIPDPPVEGALEWLYELLQTYRVVIVSSRAGDLAAVQAMHEWLQEHSTPEQWAGVGERPGLCDIVITDQKVPAVLYIDDRAYPFEGPDTFPSVETIQEFKPWNRRPNEEESE